MSDLAIKVEGLNKRNKIGKLHLDAFDIGTLVAVLVAFLIVGSLPFKAKKFGDGVIFSEAKILAQALHGARGWHEVNVSRAPGPVLFYTIPYAFVSPTSSDDSYWLAGFIWTIPWIGISVLLIRRTGSFIAGSSSGRLAAILALAIPFAIYYSYGVWGESLAYFGAAIASYGWARWQKLHIGATEFERGLIYLGLGLVLFILARPNAILLLGIGIVAVLVMSMKSEGRRAVKPAMATMTLAGATIFGVLILASLISHGGQQDNLDLVLFQGRFQYRTEPLDWRYWGEEYRPGSADFQMFVNEQNLLRSRARTESVSVDTLKRQWVAHDWLSHPLISLRQAVVRCLTLNLLIVNSKPPEAFRLFFVPGRVVYLLFHVAVNGVYVLVLIASAFFLWSRRGTLASHWILWGPYLALLIFHIATYAEPRYMFPALPGLTVMAAVASADAIRNLACGTGSGTTPVCRMV